MTKSLIRSSVNSVSANSDHFIHHGDTESQFHKTVIPGEQKDLERDPESRKIAESQIILDPGSHPASQDLAGMTNCSTVSNGGG